MEKSSAGTAYTFNCREEGRNTNTSLNTKPAPKVRNNLTFPSLIRAAGCPTSRKVAEEAWRRISLRCSSCRNTTRLLLSTATLRHRKLRRVRSRNNQLNKVGISKVSGAFLLVTPLAITSHIFPEIQIEMPSL